jgi:hypothetical protein
MGHAAEGEQVGGGCQRAKAANLLGYHVLRCTHDHAGASKRRRGAKTASNPEVEDLDACDVVADQKQVGWLQIPVNEFLDGKTTSAFPKTSLLSLSLGNGQHARLCSSAPCPASQLFAHVRLPVRHLPPLPAYPVGRPYYQCGVPVENLVLIVPH